MALSSAKGFFLFSGSVQERVGRPTAGTPLPASQDDATRCPITLVWLGEWAGATPSLTADLTDGSWWQMFSLMETPCSVLGVTLSPRPWLDPQHCCNPGGQRLGF